MNSNVVGPNQIIKVGPMQVDKLNRFTTGGERCLLVRVAGLDRARL